MPLYWGKLAIVGATGGGTMWGLWVDFVAEDMREKKITLVGAADPVFIISKLRKFAYKELLNVRPVEE
ncbi:hypothetical protein SUGI_1215570 [Cryptomeria japonica]|uniref:Uncharacterized protein n=1 Tax=Cryptomeria japonica TaxID=3369 RepID=A0AAD3RM98_CRYJA|nr:hypothetical protein SUGI_1215570 [Cryptomeria japonica]